MSGEDLAALYDVPPIVARFVGGPADGQEWRLPPEWRQTRLLVPREEPPRLTVSDDRPFPPPHAYDFQGHIADDGARLYHFAD